MSVSGSVSPEERYVIALSYQVLGQVISSIAGLGEHKAIAIDPETGVRVTITIEQAEGCAARWKPVSQSVQTPLREIEQNILDACDNVPRTIKEIASRAGYGNSPYLREAVYRLLEIGLIVRTRGGILRASP
jgi:hypothetical protein